MSDPLADLQPASLWKQFAAILRIPRPSGHEEKISEHIRAFAADNGFECVSDTTGNLLVRVPATAGMEAAPTILIQNHIDMVGEKNKDVDHDFVTDPIVPRLDGDWVSATGTTLGADNGVGVAAAMAAAVDPSVVHGPLELLFTVDEESGLTGAKGLDASMIHARTMLNLDSEEDGVIFVGCAGGSDVHITFTPAWENAAGDAAGLAVEVTGLSGGHSGLNIGENRGNAVKLLVRFLLACQHDGIDLDLSHFDAGDKHNAIPREAEARIAIDPSLRDRLESKLAAMLEKFRGELAGIDEGLEIRISDTGAVTKRMAPADRDRFLRLLAALPHGVLAMSRDLEGLVETSSNLAAVKPKDGAFLVLTSSRSSIMSSLEAVLETVRSVGLLSGAEVEVQVGYPGWKPNMDSAVLAVVQEVYRRLWDGPPEITAIHAGLECGLIGEKVPGMDMVSFGPQIEGAHSPVERVNVPSVGRFWNAFREILKALAAS